MPLSSNLQRDWRNPQWLDDNSTCDDWWNDVEPPRGRTTNEVHDVEGTSRFRSEREQELNDLIAKGLRNLSELRSSDRQSWAGNRRDSTSAQEDDSEEPGWRRTQDQRGQGQRSTSKGPRPPVRQGTQVPARAPSPAHQGAARRSSSAPGARIRSESPASSTGQFAFFHGLQSQQSSRHPNGSATPRTPSTPWRSSRSTLPPRPPLVQPEAPKPQKMITPQQLKEFLDRQQRMMDKRESHKPPPEPDHMPQASSINAGHKNGVWDHLYNVAVKKQQTQGLPPKGREARAKLEEEAKRKKEEEEAAKYPFKPTISASPSNQSTSQPSQSIFKKLYEHDPKHRASSLQILQKSVDAQQLKLCPFRPEVRTARESRDESFNDFIERLYQEAEDRKSRIEARREMVRASEKNRIEAERRKADHHYARKAQRAEERAKERRLREAELGGSAVPQEFQRRLSHDTQHSQAAHFHQSEPQQRSQTPSYQTSRRSSLREAQPAHEPEYQSSDAGSDVPPASSRRDSAQRHPVFVEPVAAETKSLPPFAPASRSAPVLSRGAEDDVLSDASRSSHRSSNSTERVTQWRGQPVASRPLLDHDEASEIAIDRQGEDSEDDEIEDMMRHADRRRITNSEPTAAAAPSHIVNEDELWDEDDEE